MAKNERTGKQVAKIAGKILAKIKLAEVSGTTPVLIEAKRICTVAELKSVVASALTQTPDRSK